MSKSLDITPLAEAVAELVVPQLCQELQKLLEGFTPPEPWMSTDDLSAHLRVPPRTIHAWAQAGCPHIRVSKGAYRFRLREVEQWLVNKNP